ncbi:MAG TPA: sigma-70 family RNA polymerase sigma factor [Planctomycetota bacterium]|nr:sigma-70 family RNA polymerase sigma factor [Planctomycetota bacterium]
MTSPHPGLQRLMDEAPYVRLLARQLVAEEADDVVQQTWLQAIQHGGDRVVSPRAWLAQIVRNVATSLHRGRARQRREQQTDGADGDEDLVPSSAELMQLEEQRRLLVAAVDRLPKHLRTVVLLRYFEGLTPRAIARRLDAPTTTVWNQLRRALQLLRERLDAEHGGDRRAWMLPLVPFAAGTNGMPWAGPAIPASAVSASALAIGVLAMTMKTKLVAATFVLLAVTGALVLWATRDPVPTSPDAPGKMVEGASVETSKVARDAIAATSPANQTERESVSAPVADTAPTGTLVLHVRYGDDKAPAAGVVLIVHRSATDPRVEGLRCKTDAAGTARFESLLPGRLMLTSDRGCLGKRAEIRGGETTELDYELDVGLTVTGIVVDAVGTPVPGALIEVAPLGRADADAEVMATSGADGRFAVRAAPTETLVGARAAGHSSSPLQFLVGKDGNTAELRLQLGPPAGSVSGIVVDAHNRPVADAVVRVGRGSTSGIVARGTGAPPIPALVRTDGDGRFLAIGLPPGNQPVVARARGKAPWQGTCEVTANLTAPLKIELADGATIQGTVRTAEGDVAARVEIEVGDWDDLAHYRTITTKEGHFELTGLPPGEVLLKAAHDDFGKAEQRTQAVAGGTSSCDLRLSRGLELHGRVVDENGAAIGKAMLDFMCMSAVPGWWNHAITDAEGRFSVPNCPEGKRLTVTVRAEGFEELQRNDVDAARGPLELQLRRSLPATVVIRGTIVDPEGKPLPNVMVHADRQGASTRDGSGIRPTGPDGVFELGPIAPGTWVVTARSPLHPSWKSEPRELGADATWDLGQVHMIAGGKATVQVEGDRTGAHFAIRDGVTGEGTALTDSNGKLVSAELAPGCHKLFVTGKNVAAQALPFDVKAGETATLTVKLTPGVRHAFELAPPVLDPLPEWVRLHVFRGNDLVVTTAAALRRGESASCEVCLLPGDYRVTVVADKREFAAATFTVGAAEGAPLRLELR